MLRDTDSASTSIWESLKRTYNRAMGISRLPPRFGQETALPPYVQELLCYSSGNYEVALRSNLGDLDREPLRATYDKDYYTEPLMDCAPYTKFIAKYGDSAIKAQIQKLTPPDRLQYLANYGKQSAEATAAAQKWISEYRMV